MRLGYERGGALPPLGPPGTEPGVEHDQLALPLRLVVRAQVRVQVHVGARPLTAPVHQVDRERVEHWPESRNRL